MKEVSGSASANVPASARRCFEMLAAVDGYPSWIGEYVRDVHVLERDSRGRPTRACAQVHVEQSPFGKDFEVEVEVAAEGPRTIRLTRVATDKRDADRLELFWRLESADGTTVTLEFAAQVSLLPAWLPVGDAGNAIARAALEAAADAIAEPRPPPRARQRASPR